ncbi:hypothetical protein ACS126_03325 [Sphingobacterium lactis]|uniref:hypothetical protein n=1 Tax=Sphingobacterium TaxID=28453 RepID=UPI0021A548A0|nr:hypothetical protein [Sphingobacterium hotanense]MCT1525816.1 hypothetical protein [Sphingobacterium hotanense]
MLDKVLTIASFANEVVEYFDNYDAKFAESEIWFDYTRDGKVIAKEYFDNNCHRIPSTVGLWIRHTCHPSAIRTCLVFLSAIEALCFTQVTQFINRDTGSTAIVSIGIKPSIAQVMQLKTIFPNAKFDLAFGNDMMSSILDCTVALWLAGKEARFKLMESGICIRYGHSQQLVESTKLSLSSFQKMFGIRSSFRTCKPPRNYTAFREMLLKGLPV